MEAVRKLKLSDAFIHRDELQEFEWTATMYNLNKGKNEELLSKCKPLKEYMVLVNCIRENQANGMSVKDAVDQAVVECINKGIMAEFLKNHRAEVMDVCITEYNEKTFVDGIREEERFKAIGRMIRKNYSKEAILDLGYSEEEYVKAEQALLVNV